NVTRRLDAEHEIVGRVLAPAGKALGRLQRIEGAVDLDAVDRARGIGQLPALHQAVGIEITAPGGVAPAGYADMDTLHGVLSGFRGRRGRWVAGGEGLIQGLVELILDIARLGCLAPRFRTALAPLEGLGCGGIFGFGRIVAHAVVLPWWAPANQCPLSFPTEAVRLGSGVSCSSFGSSTERPVSRNSLAMSCCSPWRRSSGLVSSRHVQWLPPATSGRWKLTTSWCALTRSSRVSSSPGRRMPVGCARPSSSMPRQRLWGSSHCSSVIGSPVGDSQLTSFTPSSSLYSPTRKRPRRRMGYC